MEKQTEHVQKRASDHGVLILNPAAAELDRRHKEARRLLPMAAAFVLLTAAAFILHDVMMYGQRQVMPVASIVELSRQSLIRYGVVPLLILTVLYLFFRPNGAHLIGRKLTVASAAASLWTGLVAALFVLVALQFLRTIGLSVATVDFLPDLWQPFATRLAGRPPLYLALAHLMAVLLPSLILTPYLLGGMYPVLMTRSRFAALFVTALIGALMQPDPRGMLLMFFLWYLVAYVRLSSDSLPAAMLCTAGFSLALSLLPAHMNVLSSRLFGFDLNPRPQEILLGLAFLLISLLLIFPALFYLNLLSRRLRKERFRLSLYLTEREPLKLKSRPVLSFWGAALAGVIMLAARYVVFG